MNQRQKGLQDQIDALAGLYRPRTPEPPPAPTEDEEWPDVLDYVRETTKDVEGQG